MGSEQQIKLIVDNLQDRRVALVVQITDSKFHSNTTFTIMHLEYIPANRKYGALRLATVFNKRVFFFYKYARGICTNHVVDIAYEVRRQLVLLILGLILLEIT